ncbi:MAG TPA: cytochrome c1, partial [Allosphingosinicella sp.]
EALPGPNLHFNPYFPNLNIAMPPPITADGQVTYADGTNATRDQMAKDIAAFLVWTAEPKLENRHRTGVATLLFLLIATVLAYLSYKQIWATAKRDVRLSGPLDPENIAEREAQKAAAAADGRGVEG